MRTDKTSAAGYQNFSSHVFLLGYILLVWLSTPATLNWQSKLIFWSFSLFLYWLVGLDYQKNNFVINRHWLWLPALLLVLTRLLPFFHWGEFPLAADAGVYIATFKPYVPIPVIYAFYILLNLSLGFGIYHIAKKYFDEKTAFFSLLIFSLSLSQFLTYWVFYAKMTVALLFSFLSIYLLEKKSWWAIPASVLIGYFHPLTLLPFLLAILLFSVFKKEKRKFLAVNFISILGISFIINWGDFLGYLYYTEKYLTGNYFKGISEVLAGNFVQIDFYQNFLALIYLPFALLGFIRLIYNKKYDFLFFYALINFSLIYLNFIFHNRFIILLDIVFIILAGEVLLSFLKIVWINTSAKLVSFLIFIILSINLAYQSWITEPLINKKELEEI